MAVELYDRAEHRPLAGMAWSEAAGRRRYTLFTGDLGVALLLRSCLSTDPTFPFLG